MTKGISIICATFNAERTIGNFLESIRNQSCKDFEVIIVDGKSDDNTEAIINENRDLVDKFISENDNGIYDAWNKGLQNAKFEWISFVGADDTLKPDYVKTYLDYIFKLDKHIDYISSKVLLIDQNGNAIRTLGTPWKWAEFKHKMTVAHVGSLHHINLFKKVGIYDINYKIVGDYELLLRKRNDLKAHFINETTANMLVGGSSLSFAALAERYKAQTKTAKMFKPIALWNYFRGCIELIKFKIEYELFHKASR